MPKYKIIYMTLFLRFTNRTVNPFHIKFYPQLAAFWDISFQLFKSTKPNRNRNASSAKRQNLGMRFSSLNIRNPLTCQQNASCSPFPRNSPPSVLTLPM